MKANMIAIIPARGGSKRVPNKNMRRLGGKPLIQWTIEAAQEAKSVAEVFVSTEDSNIAHFCDTIGVNVIERHPSDAEDNVHATVPTYKTLQDLGSEAWYTFVTMLLPTSPFRTSEHIDKAHNLLENNLNPSIIGVGPVDFGRENLVSFSKDSSDFKLHYEFGVKGLVQKADLEPLYAVNGAIFMADTRWFLKKRQFHTGEALGFEMNKHSSMEIDTEEDFYKAEKHFK